MSEVSELLERSIGLHRASSSFRKTVQGLQVGPDKARDWDSLTLARVLRERAHQLDPEHTDPAWQSEQRYTRPGADTHAELMAFYDKNGVGSSTPKRVRGPERTRDDRPRTSRR